MRKNYIKALTVSFALIIASVSFAQNRVIKAKHVPSLGYSKTNPIHTFGTLDTLTNHWDPIGPTPVDNPQLFTSGDCAPPDNGHAGFVAGQNCYGDKAQAQLFDPTYGVQGGGAINSILFWFGAKKEGAGTAEFTATIWDDNGGKPGQIIGTAPAFAISSIDTNAASLMPIGQPSQSLEGAFNVVAAFNSPVAIPVNQMFWAGMSYTYASGDSAGLITSADGDFADAPTHTFQKRSDDVWQTYFADPTLTWGLNVALALYPVVDFTSGVKELNSSIGWVQNSPNPAISITSISYELKENADVNISVYDITGTKVLSLGQGLQTQGRHSLKMDVSSLSAGMYFYTLTAGNHQSTQKLTVIK